MRGDLKKGFPHTSTFFNVEFVKQCDGVYTVKDFFNIYKPRI